MLTADALRAAARQSIQTPPDPQSGRRIADPLRELIPGDMLATTEVLALVKFITGRTIARGTWETGYLNTAPAARAALRRWAVLNGEKP